MVAEIERGQGQGRRFAGDAVMAAFETSAVGI